MKQQIKMLIMSLILFALSPFVIIIAHAAPGIDRSLDFSDKDVFVTVKDLIADETIHPSVVRLEFLSRGPKPAINILINSEGGDVEASLSFINMLMLAKARGKVIRCAVSGGAQSSAVFILSYCDERYALSYSVLMFHSVYIFVNGPVTAKKGAMISEHVTMIQKALDDNLQEALGINGDVYERYKEAQIIWPALTFAPKFPKFKLNIVPDIKLPSGATIL